MKFYVRMTVTQPGHALGYPVGYVFNGALCDTMQEARAMMAVGCRVVMLGETVGIVAQDDVE